MDILITPASLSGRAMVPPSKSQLHRLLICAALSEGETRIELGSKGFPAPLLSDDITATCNCLRALGADIAYEDAAITVRPIANLPQSAQLDCASSGSTLRFMLPIACALCPQTQFLGTPQLARRPIADLVTALGSRGVVFTNDEGAAIRHKVSGPLSKGMATASLRQIALPFSTQGLLEMRTLKVAGDLSSQYVSGMLFGMAALCTHRTAPLGLDAIELQLTTALESEPYLQMTLKALRDFGLVIKETPEGWSIPCNQKMVSPGTIHCEGDWSNGAVFLALQETSPQLEVLGLPQDSLQGDREIVRFLEQWKQRGQTEAGPRFDMASTPDLFPILASMASAPAADDARTTRFDNTNRLRYKESNRISSSEQMLVLLGAKFTIRENSCTITSAPPCPSHEICEVYSAQDHRIVMAAVLAAHLHKRPIVIESAECISKSFPEFFDIYRSVGGMAEELL